MPHCPTRRLAARLAFCASLALLFFSDAQAAIDAPVSPNAQPGVWSLLQVLDRTSGKSILSGQQEIAWDENRKDEDINYIVKNTGKTPTVRGFDFLRYVESASSRAQQRATQRAIDWSEKGGVVTFCCHMFMDIGSPPGRPQFYVPGANSSSPGTTFDIRQAVITGTPENKEYLAKLDVIAAELKKLRDANVPVIWRPFHECSGGWFWWGAHGATPLKKAWRIMFDRFTNKHGLNNLIWCYNPTDSATKMKAWYPGDDVVDIISLDTYPNPAAHLSFASDYKQLRAFKTNRKIVTMSENGPIPDPAKIFAEGAGWAYFCTWNGYENDPKQNTVAFLKTVYQHAKVITLDEYPALNAANSLVIVGQPLPQVVVAGAPLVLSVKTGGTGTLSYQWYKGSTAIKGATASTYTIAKATSANAGSYKVAVKTSKASVTSAVAAITVAAKDTGRITKALTQASVGPDQQNLILGFTTTTGPAAKAFLVRALGPALQAMKVTGWLADPTLTLKTSPAVTNDNWGSNKSTSAATFTSTFTKLGATALAKNSKDAALLATLKPGSYTATLSGTGGTTGVALGELYDGAPASGVRFHKITARAQVTSNSPLTLGFTITGDARMILIRAIGGQALADAGISKPLADPKLALYKVASGKSTLVVQNDNWTSGDYAVTTLLPVFTQAGASQPRITGTDAVLLRPLTAGNYTAQITATGSASGVALLEIYEVN